MRRFLQFPLIIFAAWASLANAALAQKPLAKVAANGKCPANLTELLPPNADLFKAARQISRPGTELFTASDLFDKVAAKLEFGQEVIVYQTSPGQPPANFVKLKGRDVCGWVKFADVSSVGQPRLLVELPGTEDAKDAKGGKSKLLAKVVAMAIRDGDRLLQVPVYNGPFDVTGAAPTKQRHINYYAILNVYDHKTHDGAGCRSLTDDDQCFLLVGGYRDAEGKGQIGTAQLHGWVRSKHVALWPSAMSLYYKEGVKDVKIFKDEAAARKASSNWGLFPPDESLVLATKKDRHGEPKTHNIPRFPIIEKHTLDWLPTKQARYFLYEVVIAGDVCPASDARCVNAPDVLTTPRGEEALAERGRLGKNLMRSKGLDMLLVVDGTESMDRYYGPIIQAVEAVSKEANAEGLIVRFATATFGDYKGANAVPSEVMMKWPAKFNRDPAVLRNLNRGLVGPDPHRDLPEAPLAAIIQALDTVKDDWSSDSAFKIVIWIGDHGNRPKGRHTTPGGQTITETVGEEDVAKVLVQLKANFGAIQVRGKYDAEQNARMLASANKIKELMDASYKNPFSVVTADVSPKATDAEITEVVRKKLLEHIDQGSDIETLVRERSEGKTTSTVDMTLPGAQFADWYIENELKLSPQKLREMAAQVQQIRPGYVVQDEKKPTFAYWMALRESEFKTIYDSMGKFCDALTSAEVSTDTIVDVMTAVIRGVTFEEPEKDEPIDEYLSKKWSVPKDNFSPLLSRSINEFASWYLNSTSDNQAEYRGTICRKVKWLDLAGKKQRIKLEDIVIDNGRPVLKAGVTPETFHWDWAINTGIRYYYLPLEFLP